MAVDFEKIKTLREELKKLLEENPEYQSLQDEVDRKLKACGNDHQKRNQVIQEMMCNKWYEIVPAWLGEEE